MSVQYGGDKITFSDGSTVGSGWTGMKNRIINGAMMIDQRNAGASVTNTTSNVYTLDRFFIYGSQASKFTVQQNAGSVTPPAGFSNYLGVTSSSAYTVGSGEEFGIYHRIEGFNTADLNWGTANAKTVTLSFWVRSSLTGTFGGSINNSGNSRSYPFSYTISAANTWEQKSITIAGDTTGTWVGATNGYGIQLVMDLGCGSTLSGTANTWAGASYFAPTGATSVVGTSGATFYITGVQLEKGSTATSFDYRPYGTELLLCQRYYYKIQAANSYSAFGSGGINFSTQASFYIKYATTMRTAPTLSYSGALDVYAATTAYPVTASVAGYTAVDQALWQITTGGGMTAGQGAVLLASNNNTAFVSLTAEL